MPAIKLSNLSKTYLVNKKASWKDYLKLSSAKVKHEALKNINLEVEKGETLGLIGLNGAGKSTMIKIMCGILKQSSGTVSVLGRDPFQERAINNRKISSVFGQRTKLRWDVSPMESYKLIRDMYDVKEEDFQRRLKHLTSKLKMESIINSPVRGLSLGQRMKAELAGSFLYEPELIFLDEPTIGLDILSKESIYDFLKDIKGQATLILTTHDFEDIERICDRVVILHEGEIIMDQDIGAITHLSGRRYAEIAFRVPASKYLNLFESCDYAYEVKDSKVRIFFSQKENVFPLLGEIFSEAQEDLVSLELQRINFKDYLKDFLSQKLEQEV